MSKKFYQSIPQNAGAVARQWRYGLAATAERCDDSIRTLKFPLDGAEVEWTGASQLHSVVSGNGRGSLIGFLYAMMLGGFRVFGKQSASESFRNQASLDNASWTAGVCASSPLTVAKGTFIPSVIYQRLLVAPRSVGGKDSSFRSETIAIEYAKTFCAGKHGENVPEPERVLFNAIGVAIANTFGSWKDVVSSPSDAAGVIDEVIKTLQYPIPKRTLKQRIGAIKACEPAGTVAYDRSVAPVEASSGIEANLIVALALRAGRSDGLSDKKELTRFSQEYLTGDANHGGLAWLYGKGLVDYFTKVTTEQCIADFDIPPERAFFVDIALDAARSIPSASTTLFGGKNYASYRMGIGGLLGSWIANYITRLFDLEVALSAPPDPLTLPVALLADERMFAEIDVLPQEIEALCQKALDERGVALGCLQRLMGTGNATASAQDIETIEAYNSLLSTLEGLLSALKDRVAKARAIAVASKDDVALDNLKSYEFKVPGWIAKLDRLNRLDLSPVDPQAVLDKASEEFTVLHSAMFDHYERIQNWAHSTGETLSALQRQSLRERGYLHNTRSRRDPDEYAVRSCLEMIGRSARKCSEPTLRKVVGFFARHEVFTELSHCNQYFFNRRGTLYKSPFDKNPRQPFAITVRSVEHASGILIAYSAFLKELRVEVMSDAVLSHQRVSDLYRLERGHFAMQLVGFPEEIPARLALPEVLEEVFNLPLPIKLRLGAVTVSSAVMRKIFNHYYVRLEHLVALLLRERFFVRAKFQRSGDNALLYVPSGEQLWSAPARLYDTGKPIGEAMRRLEESHGSRGPIDAPLAMAFLCDSTESMNDTSIRAYLRQAPHDWHFPWPGQTSATGLMYDKDNGFAKRPVKVSTCRMVGSPAFKGVLDTMVTHPELVTTGDAAVLVDQHFSQETIKSSSGRIITRISPEKAVVNLAIR